MAQPYTTGPIYLWAGMGNPAPGTPTFIGTAESFPRQQHRPKFGEVRNDISGSQQPLDMHFQGADAMISLTLTYWNDNSVQLMELVPGAAGRFAPSTGGGSPIGGYFAEDVGTMMMTEGCTFPIWLVYPSARVHAAMGTLPAGYRYPTCIFRGPWDNEGGAKEMKRQIIFQAYPFWNASNHSFTLYDYDMSALPGTPPGTRIN